VKQAKVPFICLTNSGGKTESHKAQHYTHLLQTDVPPLHVVQSHSPMRLLLPTFVDKHILVASRDDASADVIMKEYGFTNYTTLKAFGAQYPFLNPLKHYPPHPSNSIAAATMTPDSSSHKGEPIQAIFVLDTPEDWEEALQIMCDVLLTHGHMLPTASSPSEQLPVFFANPDISYAHQYHLPRFTNGAFRLCLERLYKEVSGKDLQYTIYGKPFKRTYDYALERLSAIATQFNSPKISTVYAIGDNPASDICGANEMGWFSILVRTGVWQSEEENDRQYPAAHVCPSVVEAIDFIFERQKL
jgi:HAD superfamily hydrolase (TIGR01456 family)